ncbi:CG33217 [Drosophila busckii]|uniref:CG33217 n=1 Tax=Drosophila busckii TaxID=30019 RepID=A0A0M5J8T4_DROBS|nr:CG33217 [Drosophila busckii]
MSGIGSVLVSIANANIDVQNAYLNALDLNFRATITVIQMLYINVENVGYCYNKYVDFLITLEDSMKRQNGWITKWDYWIASIVFYTIHFQAFIMSLFYHRAFRRLCNLIEYFKIALCQPYPSTKLIRPMPILEFIQRGLELSYVDAANNTNLDDLCLGIFLPQIHVKLLELLEMLIDICQTHLRMNFRMITNILVETLKRTRKSSLGATHIHLLNLRSKVYKVFLLWISVIREGSGCEQIVECLVKEIMEDVKIKRKDGHTVSVSKQKDTAGNKRKQNNNAKVETSQKKETELYLDKVIVCTEALRCLQAILISSSYLLKPHVLKETYLTIFEVCASNYEKRISLDNMYNKSECRLEMYRALFTLTKLRNLCHPPCTELILYLLDAACTKDSCSIIRTSCKIMLSTSELVIHPHKENFAFKTKLQNTLTEHPHLNAMLPNPIHSEEMRKCQNMFTSSILSKDDEQKYTQNSGDNQNNGIRIITKNISLQNDQITVEDEFVATKNTVIDTKIPVYTCSKHTKNELKRKDNIIIQQTFPVLIGVEKPIEREAKINQEDNECIDELQGMFVDELK